MGERRKISIRKVMQVLLGLAVTGCCITALLSAAGVENNNTVVDVDVNITNGAKYSFLDDAMVKTIAITDRHVDLLHTPMKSLDIQRMEHILAANPWVANAQAYIDNKRVLHLTITQRVPVARVFENNGGSYYLDTSLTQVPLSKKYTYYTTIVTNVPRMHNDSTSKAIKGEIVGLVRYVEQNSFWRAQIAQIVMDSSNSFQLVPVLGNHIILLGDTTDMQEKFDNLLQFYKKIMNHIGWDKYEKLDLRFKGQVVASPALPWKGPVDKGMKTMSWYNSIMDSLRSKNDEGTAAPVAAAPIVKVVAPVKAKVLTQAVKAPAKPPPIKHIAVAAAKKPPAKHPPVKHIAVAAAKKLPAKHPPQKAKVVSAKKKTVNDKYIYKGNNSAQSH